MRSATANNYLLTLGIKVSIHTLHAERDPSVNIGFMALEKVSIHTLHAERDIVMFGHFMPFTVSIHTLHAERDIVMFGHFMPFTVSIHTLHAERDKIII